MREMCRRRSMMGRRRRQEIINRRSRLRIKGVNHKRKRWFLWDLSIWSTSTCWNGLLCDFARMRWGSQCLNCYRSSPRKISSHSPRSTSTNSSCRNSSGFDLPKCPSKTSRNWCFSYQLTSLLCLNRFCFTFWRDPTLLRFTNWPRLLRCSRFLWRMMSICRITRGRRRRIGGCVT